MPMAVLLKVDGTLIDSKGIYAATRVDAFRHSEVDAAEVEVGSSMDKIEGQMLPTVPGPGQQRGREISAFRSELFKRDYLPRTQAFPEMRSVLERIKAAGQTVVLASSGKDAAPLNAQGGGKAGPAAVALLCGGFGEEVLHAAGCTAPSETRQTFARLDTSALVP